MKAGAGILSIKYKKTPRPESILAKVHKLVFFGEFDASLEEAIFLIAVKAIGVKAGADQLRQQIP